MRGNIAILLPMVIITGVGCLAYALFYWFCVRYFIEKYATWEEDRARDLGEDGTQLQEGLVTRAGRYRRGATDTVGGRSHKTPKKSSRRHHDTKKQNSQRSNKSGIHPSPKGIRSGRLSSRKGRRYRRASATKDQELAGKSLDEAEVEPRSSNDGDGEPLLRKADPNVETSPDKAQHDEAQHDKAQHASPVRSRHSSRASPNKTSDGQEASRDIYRDKQGSLQKEPQSSPVKSRQSQQVSPEAHQVGQSSPQKEHHSRKSSSDEAHPKRQKSPAKSHHSQQGFPDKSSRDGQVSPVKSHQSRQGSPAKSHNNTHGSPRRSHHDRQGSTDKYRHDGPGSPLKSHHSRETSPNNPLNPRQTSSDNDNSVSQTRPGMIHYSRESSAKKDHDSRRASPEKPRHSRESSAKKGHDGGQASPKKSHHSREPLLKTGGISRKDSPVKLWDQFGWPGESSRRFSPKKSRNGSEGSTERHRFAATGNDANRSDQSSDRVEGIVRNKPHTRNESGGLHTQDKNNPNPNLSAIQEEYSMSGALGGSGWPVPDRNPTSDWSPQSRGRRRYRDERAKQKSPEGNQDGLGGFRTHQAQDGGVKSPQSSRDSWKTFEGGGNLKTYNPGKGGDESHRGSQDSSERHGVYKPDHGKAKSHHGNHHGWGGFEPQKSDSSDERYKYKHQGSQRTSRSGLVGFNWSRAERNDSGSNGSQNEYEMHKTGKGKGSVMTRDNETISMALSVVNRPEWVPFDSGTNEPI